MIKRLAQRHNILSMSGSEACSINVIIRCLYHTATSFFQSSVVQIIPFTIAFYEKKNAVKFSVVRRNVDIIPPQWKLAIGVLVIILMPS